jgi:YbbR domain-containing protein
VRDLLRRWFLENVALKTVALVLAVTLFILVRGEKETERSVKVRVAYVKPVDRTLINEVPQTVDVWVRGPWTRIKRLDTDDIDPVVLDLTKAGDGEVPLEDSAVRLPVGLRVMSIRPAKVAVAFEYQKRVPVVPEVVGALASGFVVRALSAEPAVVGVRGPKGVIDGVVDVRTMPIPLAGKRAPFHGEVALVPPPRGAACDAERVDVTVQIEEEVAQKTLAALPIQVMPPPGVKNPPGYDVAPSAVDVLLRGPKNAIKQVDDHKVTAVVDLHVEDLTPQAPRAAPVMVRGTPPGVAVEVHPSEITLSMKPLGTPRQERRTQ